MLDSLRESKFSEKFHFWVNYFYYECLHCINSIKSNCKIFCLMLVGTISLSIQPQQNEAQSLCLVLGVHKISPNKKTKESIRQWQLEMKIFMCVSNSTQCK